MGIGVRPNPCSFPFSFSSSFSLFSLFCSSPLIFSLDFFSVNSFLFLFLLNIEFFDLSFVFFSVLLVDLFLLVLLLLSLLLFILFWDKKFLFVLVFLISVSFCLLWFSSEESVSKLVERVSLLLLMKFDIILSSNNLKLFILLSFFPNSIVLTLEGGRTISSFFLFFVKFLFLFLFFLAVSFFLFESFLLLNLSTFFVSDCPF